MKPTIKNARRIFINLALISVLFPAIAQAETVDPLPPWNEGATKKSIVDFVTRVTKENSLDFVPPAERIRP